MMTPKRKFIPHHSSRGSPRSAAARSDDEAGCRFSKQEDVLAIHCQPRLVTGRKIRLKENGKDFKCDICQKNFSSKSALNTHRKTIHSDVGTIASFNCTSCSKSFETSRGLKLHESRYCSKLNDEIKDSNCAGPSSLVDTGPLAVHSCEQNSDTNHYVSSRVKSAFSHTKNADFEIKNTQTTKKEKIKLPSSKNRQRWKKIEDDVEIALKRAMPKHTWKSRDISSVVENFENIVYDIVKKHCFVEPSNSKREKPKTEKKDVVLERLKHRKKIL